MEEQEREERCDHCADLVESDFELLERCPDPLRLIHSAPFEQSNVSACIAFKI